jgi:hypothetical protein
MLNMLNCCSAERAAAGIGNSNALDQQQGSADACRQQQLLQSSNSSSRHTLTTQAIADNKRPH